MAKRTKKVEPPREPTPPPVDEAPDELLVTAPLSPKRKKKKKKKLPEPDPVESDPVSEDDEVRACCACWAQPGVLRALRVFCAVCWPIHAVLGMRSCMH